MSLKIESIDLLFAGFLVDEKTFEVAMNNESSPQHAAHRHQKTIIDMLLLLNWRSFKILGSIPVSAFPKNKNLLFRHKIWGYKGVSGYLPFSINFPLIKEFSRFLGFLKYLVKWVGFDGAVKNKNKLIFLYALHTPHLLPIFLVKVFCGVKVMVYVPDLPKYMSAGANEPLFKRWLKSLDSCLLLWMANRLDGRIVITENMFSCLEKNNGIVIDSIAFDEKSIVEPEYDLPDGNNVVYSGGLKDDYGIREMVDCFLNLKIKSSKLNLVICGGGVLSEWCKKMASENTNIFYLGVINNKDVVSIQRKSFALINLRKTTEEYTKYSFPSKINSGVSLVWVLGFVF